MYKLLLFCVLIIGIFTACKSKEKVVISTIKVQSTGTANVSAQLVVYKTTNDYLNLVPVIMNEERTKIVSYPAPTDVSYEGKLATPSVLKNGYLLDNRGINENVVFLSFTYEEFSKLKEAPSLEVMMSKIVDKYPLKELIFCGEKTNFKNIIDEVNVLIDNGFTGCRKIQIVPMQIKM
jgi:hypothetical protein